MASDSSATTLPPLEGRTLCVDIDHTIYHAEEPLDYANGKAVPGAIEALAQLKAEGWAIVLFTARHFNHWQTTKTWLDGAGVPYDHLVFGKPPARYYIDDRAVAFRGSWSDILAFVREG